jgi:hypothetical protein
VAIGAAVALEVDVAGRAAADVRCAVTVRESTGCGVGDGVGVGRTVAALVRAGATRTDVRGTGRGRDARAVADVERGKTPAARLIGANAGRCSGASSAEAALLDGAASAGCRFAARPIPRATTAQPATASDATHAETPRPTDM